MWQWQRVEHGVDKNLSNRRKVNKKNVVASATSYFSIAALYTNILLLKDIWKCLDSLSNAELTIFPKTKIGVKCLSRDCVPRLNSNKPRLVFFSLV